MIVTQGYLSFHKTITGVLFNGLIHIKRIGVGIGMATGEAEINALFLRSIL
jgi:hypothetical protein